MLNDFRKVFGPEKPQQKKAKEGMKTQCPKCNTKQDVPDFYADKEVTCTKCKGRFTATKISSPVIRRKIAVFLLVGSILLTFFLTKFYSFSAGWAKGYDDGYYDGYNKGFWGGVESEKCIAKWTKNPQTNKKSSDVLLSGSGEVSNPEWRIVEQDERDFTISWQFTFNSYVSSNVMPVFMLYDADGFLLQECFVFGLIVEVIENQTYNFTGKEFISKEVGSKIARCDAIVRKLDF